MANRAETGLGYLLLFGVIGWGGYQVYKSGGLKLPAILGGGSNGGNPLTPPGPITGTSDLKGIAQQYAQQYGVPWSLLSNQIQTESAWNPHAVSSAGAQGIAQFLPATAHALGLADPLDPIGALNTMASYMKSLYTKYGNWSDALVAYHAGEGNVANYHANPSAFPKTQAYVVGILKAAGLGG